MKISNYIYIVLSVLTTGFFYSCNNNSDTTPIEMGYDFYPLEKGNYVVYDVKKVVYNVVGTVDTFKFQLKERVGDTVAAIGNNPTAFKIERYSRKIGALDTTWHLDSVWQAWKNDKALVKTQNGVSYQNLSFPIKNGVKWNGNKYNNKDVEQYEFRSLGNTMFINGNVYDNTVVVIQSDSIPVNYVEKNYRAEYYAKKIGLIYKEWQIYTYDQASLGSFIIQSGSHYIQQIKYHGKE